MSKSALIIVDMVRDFTDPNGLVYYPQNREILPQIRKVLDKCREKGLLIVFMQHCNRKGKVDRKAQAMRPNCIEGTFGVARQAVWRAYTARHGHEPRAFRWHPFFSFLLDLNISSMRSVTT